MEKKFKAKTRHMYCCPVNNAHVLKMACVRMVRVGVDQPPGFSAFTLRQHLVHAHAEHQNIQRNRRNYRRYKV